MAVINENDFFAAGCGKPCTKQARRPSSNYGNIIDRL
jgi:hypothetical protein